MQKATLLHNPKAGDKAHTKKELISLIENEGIKCTYSSVKKDKWDHIDPKTDFVIIAGGDGTVRKVVKKLWKNDEHDNYKFALLPLGTANNIAKTLDIPEKEVDIIKSWKDGTSKKMDAGIVSGLAEPHLFLESFGLGIFPVLMEKMKYQAEEKVDTPEKKLKTALKTLIKLIDSYRPPYFEILIDGKEYKDNYLLIEIMNTQSIGPNLGFSPDANTSDGEFEVVMISEHEKEKFKEYIKERLEGIENEPSFELIKAKKVVIKCEKYDAHADDEILKVKKTPSVEIEVMEGFLKFLG